LPNFNQSYFRKRSFKYINTCFNNSTNFIIEDVSAIDSLLWDFNDVESGILNLSKEVSPSHVFTNTGIYKVKLTVWYNNIETNYFENVKIIPLPEINLGKDTTFCLANNYTLNAYSPHLSYLWNNTSTDSIIHINESNNYWCNIENIYTGCKNSDTVNIIFSEIPEIELGNDTSFCENTSFIIDAFHANYTYMWQDNSNASNFTTDTAGTFFVEVKNENECANSDTIILSIKNIPRFNFQKDTIICENTSFTLAPVLENDVNYFWQDESINNSFLVKQEGFYKLISSNICGTWSDSINVATRYCGDIYIPNFFTPTGDGVNELFLIKGIEEDAWDLKIYSRWGELVFHSRNYLNNWNGDNLTPAVYYYILSNIKLNEEYKGTLRIIKDKK